AALWWARRRGSAPRPDRAVLRVATAGGVALMLAVFVVAPVQQAPGTSVASMNLAMLTGDGCGLADALTVAVPGDATPALPSDPPRLTGVMRDGPPPDRPSIPGPVWHTEDAGTGTLDAGWFPVPAGTTRLILPLTGDLRGDQAVRVESGAGTATVDLPGTKVADWRDVAVTLPGPADRVRVVVDDRIDGPDTWLAVGAPRPARDLPARTVLGDAPVFADQASAVLWPCQDQIAVRHGIAQAPQWRLRTGDDLEGATEATAFFPANGGTLAGIGRTATFDELPSRLDPPGGRAMFAPAHVERVRYEHPTDGWDLTVGTQRRWGWERLPTLADKDYTGRDFLG
ncbi:arabinosyltransferase C-terminal domain-containing protein, partial [Pseudonocardia sp. SID8383]|uniref:arabinosyltransferase C-terminal domain-containing protein n=1 Tax=Pseudonocardia sp. SID8383 TaxID=2690363 RepID=UPI0013862F62